jgi:hypothetical protein
MVELPPLSTTYSVIKPEKIKKDEPLSEPPKRKKKQALAEQESQPVQHIDELV